jgi:hypothetical protein
MKIHHLEISRKPFLEDLESEFGRVLGIDYEDIFSILPRTSLVCLVLTFDQVDLVKFCV